MTMATYLIRSYAGVDGLDFGVARSDVHRVLGQPARTRTSRFSAELTDSWFDGSLRLTFGEAPGAPLTEVTLYPSVGSVQLEGLDLFGADRRAIYWELCKRDGDARVTVGVTVLLRLGIAITGFLHADATDQAVTAFARGRWQADDDALSERVPLPS
jgi:hypothetical protein